MEDLLKEEDFKSIKKYNPWKGFFKFYIIACIHAAFSYLIFLFTEEESFSKLLALLLYISVPFILPFIIFFYRIENRLLKKRTIILSIFILTSLYSINFYLMYAGGVTFHNDTPSIAIGISVLLFFYFIVITPIMILILNYKRKKLIKSIIK